MVFFPFVYPRGFVGFPLYKFIFTSWMYFAAIISLAIIICKHGLLKTIKKPWIKGTIIYCFILFLITFCVQKGVHEGIQKIFITPIVCIVFDYYMSTSKSKTISVFSNILIALLLFNVVFLNPIIFSNIVDSYHVIFLGHVQVAAQYAILGLLMSVLSLKITNNKKKSVILGLLSIGTLLFSETSTGFICLAIIVFSFVFKKRKAIKKIFSLTPITYAVFGILISLFLIFSTVVLKWYNKIDFIDLTYSGRAFVWNPALELIKEHWIIGYGAFGVLIKTFWSAWSGNSNGMNYAHSVLIQQLLDGGIVLLIAFFIMMSRYLLKMSKISESGIRYWVTIFLCCFLVICFFESTTEYFYLYIFLSITSELQQNQLYLLQKGERLNGHKNVSK